MVKAIIQQLACFVCIASGIRKSRGKHESDVARTIASRLELWSYAAPQISSPALPAANGGCIQGVRVTASRRNGLTTSVDNVPILLGPLGFRHPLFDNLDLNGVDMEERTCPGNEPILGLGTVSLHGMELYRDRILETNAANSRIVVMTRVGLNNSYNENSRESDSSARAVGWRLVETAVQQPGPVVSHLFQSPETLECVLTFQGSSRFDDWMDNINVGRVHFCGLPVQVHRGFRNAMQSMVNEPSWQNGIRPYLGKCSKVNVVGHSLGGATATLFHACASRAPGGNPDWEMMSFTPGTPERLTYKFG